MNILDHATPSTLYNEKLAAHRQLAANDAYEFARDLANLSILIEANRRAAIYWQERAAREYRAVALRLGLEF